MVGGGGGEEEVVKVVVGGVKKDVAALKVSTSDFFSLALTGLAKPIACHSQMSFNLNAPEDSVYTNKLLFL